MQTKCLKLGPQGHTQAMLTVLQGNTIIPPEHMHSPTICDKEGYTVAMHFALRGFPIPSEWCHYPTFR